jgi:hypothetical protein
MPDKAFVVIALASLALGLGLLASSAVVQERPSTGENLHLEGKLDIMLYDEFGNLKDERHLDNLIVDVGFEGVASRIAPHDGELNSGSPYNYIAIGTSSTAVNAGQTSLAAELSLGPNYSRVQDSVASYSVSTGKQLTLTGTWVAGQGTGTISESGIFNSSTGGDMLARQVFSSISKGTNDSLTITWTITLSTS